MDAKELEAKQSKCSSGDAVFHSEAERRGAPVVRNFATPSKSDDASVEKPEASSDLEVNGPSWIRTRDQSVMSRQL
jgi:hypothetical protein